MGMSTHVVFLRDKEDKQYKEYLAVFLACKKAKVALPDEINDYFGDDSGPEYPLEIDADDYLREWGNDYSSGYEIDIDKIPEGVKTIRFYNSW